jgi:hypothetical protein
VSEARVLCPQGHPQALQRGLLPELPSHGRPHSVLIATGGCSSRSPLSCVAARTVACTP